jgi:hypothetical protein
MERLSDWTSKHPWAYPVVGPILLVYLAVLADAWR